MFGDLTLGSVADAMIEADFSLVSRAPAVARMDQQVPQLEGAGMVFENEGYCPICQDRTVFVALDTWLSENYVCKRCNTLPRHRALVVVLDYLAPNWRERSIHESSPTNLIFAQQCPKYSTSQYLENVPPGQVNTGIRCENLEQMTFKDESFDIFITQAVLGTLEKLGSLNGG